MFAGAFALEEYQLTFEELLLEVEASQVLAACVLRQANTQFNHPPTARLHDAAARLGEARLRALVSRIGLQERDDYDAAQNWQHSLRAATAARLLAERTHIIDADDAYTLGLLHDVGEGLLRALFPGEIEAMRGLEQEARIEEEIALFGVDHAQVGQWVLESCGLPHTLTSIVQTHHDVMRINTPAALLLHVADAIAHADTPYKVSALDPLGSDRLAMLGLSRLDLADLHTRTTTAIEPQLALMH
jgi:putative nucleotidyltransferase with HDIG domain